MTFRLMVLVTVKLNFNTLWYDTVDAKKRI